MSSHVRQGMLSPGAASRKRKARDEPLPPPEPAKAKAKAAEPSAPDKSSGASNNKLLAGYLAHEFLTSGTLLGQPPGAPPVAAAGAAEGSGGGGRSREEVYMQVAYLLKGEGDHIPGVVNPTQLARWLQI